MSADRIPAAAVAACRASVGIDETDAKLGAIWNRCNRQQHQTLIGLSGAGLSEWAGSPWHEVPPRYRTIILKALVDLRDRLDKMLPPEQFPFTAPN